MSWVAASMRNLGFDVRAGAPRRSHASSLRRMLRRFVSATVRLALSLHALQHVGRVAALERVDGAVVHLPHPRAHRIEEPAVVRHEQQAARVARPPRGQVRGEPRDALDVEVVRGLVERDDVPLADEQTGEPDAAALTTRQRGDHRVQRHVAQQPVEHVAHARVAEPLVLGAVADDRVADGLVVRQVVVLGQHPDPHAAAQRHAPGIADRVGPSAPS